MFKKLIMLVLVLVLSLSNCDSIVDLSEVNSSDPRYSYMESGIVSVKLMEQYNSTGISVEFTNNSSEMISIFRPDIPGPFLGKDLFDIGTSAFELQYRGKLAVYRETGPGSWVSFMPGEISLFSVDLSHGYDFPVEDYYDVKYSSYVTLKRETGEIEAHYVSSSEITIRIDVPVFFRAGAEPPCNSSQNNKAKQAMQHGKGKTQNAINYLAKKGMDSYYIKWFGAKNNTRFNKIKTGYDKILTAINKGTEHLCAPTCDGFAAYVYKGRPYVIHWCGSYINRASISDIGETGIHEVSHWDVVMSTDDHVYGKTGSMDLAKNSPDKAIDNADNVCFYPYDIPNAPTGPVEPPIDPPIDPPGTDVIVSLYQHSNYKGYRGDYKNVRDYNIDRLISKGVKNDDVSSIKVKAGYEAILYEHKDFQGISKVIKGNVPSLKALNFNDKLSSMKIRKSGTEPPVEPPPGQDVLLAGKFMKPGETLLSANGAYRFWFQNNGMLVIRSVHENGKVLWVGGSANAVRLHMQKDGNLVQYNDNNKAIWASGTDGKKVTKLQMLNSGKIAIMNGNNIIWSKPEVNVNPPVEPPIDPPSNEKSWTYVVLGDTQFLSQSSTGLDRLKKMMKFIIDKRNSLNIKFVVSVGDMTQSGNNASEWNRVKIAYQMLDDAGIPFTPCQGNHDSKTSINNYFGYVKNKPHFGGMKDGIFNAYYLFNVGSDKVVVVVTEKEHSTNDRNWASGIFKKYSDRLGIKVNHDIGKNDAIYNNVTRGNNNVMMGVMGHICNEDRWTSKSVGGFSQTFARSDYQCRSNKGAFIRYYTFEPGKKRVCAKTYNVTDNKYETDGDSQFCFNY